MVIIFKDFFAFFRNQIKVVYVLEETNIGNISGYMRRLIPKSVAPIQNEEVGTYDLDRKKINLISNKSFRYYNL